MRHVLLALGIYHPAVHRGVARFAKENEWLLDSCLAFRRTLPRSWDGDGMLVNTFAAPEFEKMATNMQKPTVYIGQTKRSDWPSVDNDSADEACLAIEHFRDRGFTSFATYSDRITEYAKPLDEFRCRLKAEGSSCPEIRAIEGNSSDLLAHVACELRECRMPLAVLARDDNAAVELLHACLRHGLSVPEQVAILGIRNDPLVCDAAPIPISSIARDLETIGYEAASLLERQMNGERVPRGTRLVKATGIITRQSSDILAYPHERLAAALGFIRENYTRKLLNSEIAEVAGMSARGLYHAFREHLGRSVSEEVLRLRLEHACRMLKDTRHKISTIALEAGFGDRRRLHVHFTKAYGITPRSFRLTEK